MVQSKDPVLEKLAGSLGEIQRQYEPESVHLNLMTPGILIQRGKAVVENETVFVLGNLPDGIPCDES